MIPRDENRAGGPPSEAEKTLRLLASLPAPEGLAGRVKEGLRAAPRGRLLEWPAALMPGGWMGAPALRGMAAAAIVCIVAGGGWRIYTQVQARAAPTANVVVMPARVGSQGAFSNAGAMRTPDSLTKPVLTHPTAPATQQGTASNARQSTPIHKPEKKSSRHKGQAHHAR